MPGWNPCIFKAHIVWFFLYNQSRDPSPPPAVKFKKKRITLPPPHQKVCNSSLINVITWRAVVLSFVDWDALGSLLKCKFKSETLILVGQGEDWNL